MDLAAAEDLRRLPRGVDELVGQAGARGEVEGLGPPGQDGLGADVEGAAAQMRSPDLAADAVAALQDGQLRRGVEPPDLLRGGQAADATTDHQV